VRTFTDLRGQSRPRSDLPLFDAPATVRTFDSPEFRDITFYEVEAKSILNRVPAASRMPFEWTINVYRGCSHACVYCGSGETPILMANGRTKPLADVRAGDTIYGTTFDGKYHRYQITPVLDHWATIKPAYRVVLSDDTELVVSGDHRFLTGRGWKHVIGSEQGWNRRPHLTLNSELLGTGRFASQPKIDQDYKLGYLCGMIRGDGLVHSATYVRSDGRGLTDANSFRLALVDLEALHRSRDYLTEFNVPTKEFVFQKATGARKQMTAIRTGARASVEAIRTFIAWPRQASTSWCKGFLAGIFDAEGSCHSNGALRISNTNQVIIDQITSCLQRFNFKFVVETSAKVRPKPVRNVRLVGGLREHLRFFHTVDPAITRKRTIEGGALKGAPPLRVVAIQPMGLDLPMYDITTGTGDYVSNGIISHNCFARPSHTYLNFDAGRDFERKVVVKVNAPEVLRRELRRKSWTGAHVAMGTNTDPYQRCEGRYRLTRGVLEVLRDYANPCSVLTKSPLLLRDLDLFVELAETAGFSANLSIGTLDEEVWRRSEPGTPHPKARMAAVKQLVAAGIPCGILMAPILPGISDSPEQLRAVVRAAADAGASHLTPLTLHLRPGVKEEFLPWLEATYPELVPDYRRLYRGSNAPKPVREAIASQVQTEKRRHRTFAAPTTPTGGRRAPDPPRRDRPPRSTPPRDSPPQDSTPQDSTPRDPPAGASEPATQLSLSLG
jgi:DNA repair photolyase